MLLLVRPMAMGRYYDCTVQEATAHGYKVAFTAYGNVEEVPLEYLQKKEVLTSTKVQWFKLLKNEYSGANFFHHTSHLRKKYRI